MNLVTPRTVVQKYEVSDFESFCEEICNDAICFWNGNSREITDFISVIPQFFKMTLYRKFQIMSVIILI